MISNLSMPNPRTARPHPLALRSLRPGPLLLARVRLITLCEVRNTAGPSHHDLVNGSLLMKSTKYEGPGIALIAALWTCETASGQEKGDLCCGGHPHNPRHPTSPLQPFPGFPRSDILAFGRPSLVRYYALTEQVPLNLNTYGKGDYLPFPLLRAVNRWVKFPYLRIEQSI